MTAARDQAAHDSIQAARWSRADAAHFEWQTALPYCAEREAALLDGVAAPRGRLLEVGCGEGGNLHHLRGRAAARHGIDRYPSKVTFARARDPDLRLAVADAARLPYRDGAFEAVLVRDVLHHVSSRAAVLAEAWRVLAPGGCLFVVEPNTFNPMMLVFGLTVRPERGLLVSTRATLFRELAALPRSGPVDVVMCQPLPLERVVFNPRFGRPALTRSRLARAALVAVETAAHLAVPRAVWAYVRARTTKMAGA